MSPRLAGPISDWSGLNAPDGQSWLVNEAAEMHFNEIWFLPLFDPSARATIDAEKKQVTRSLYATRHHGVLNPEVSATKTDFERDRMPVDTLNAIDALDNKHLEHFTAEAGKKGIRVMGDLVFNQLAADHPLVLKEESDIAAIRALTKDGAAPEIIKAAVKDENGAEAERVIGISYTDPTAVGSPEKKTYYFKFARNENLETLNMGYTTGYDTAQVNYASPAAKEFFVGTEEQPGYFMKIMDWFMDRGFKDYRCDLAYRLPPDWWAELITHARLREPDCRFMAETLGASAEAVKRMKDITVKDGGGRDRPGFDLGMVSNFWWNFTDDWLPDQELPRLRDMAKFGGATSPDNHDTAETLAGHFNAAFTGDGKDDKIAEVCIRNYVLCALMSNSVYMQMGYEYCKEKQNGVFAGQVSRADWDELVRTRGGDSELNIKYAIEATNRLKESLGVENCIAKVTEHSKQQDDKLVKIAVEFTDADTGAKKADVVLLLNAKPEDGPVTVSDPKLLALDSDPSLHLYGGRGQDALKVRDILIFHTPVDGQGPAPALMHPSPVALRRPRALKPAA